MDVDFTREDTYRRTREHVTLASTLIPEAYYSPQYYSEEQNKVFHSAWVCVGFTDQVSKVGDTFCCNIAKQDIFIIRDQKRQIRAYYNVCRHRGSQLIQQDGNYKNIRCPYHSWVYSPSGELLVTPLFKGHDLEERESVYYTEHSERLFCKKDYPLLNIRVDTWGCFIFVNLDGKACPLKEWLGDLPERFARYPLEELKLFKSAQFDVKANWKLIAENFMEYYHLPTIHPELVRVSKVNLHYRHQGPGMYMGFCTSPLSQDPQSPFELLPVMPGLNKQEAESAMWIHIYPNISLFLLPNNLFTLLLRPQGPSETVESIDLLAHPNVIQTPGYEEHIAEIFKYWDRVNRQDFEAVERVQKGVSNKAYRGGRMCERFEEPIHRFQNMIIDSMVGKHRIPKGDEDVGEKYFISQSLNHGEAYDAV
jgi:choline monooxygenase